MAFSATTAWDVRTTGSNSNGGGFNTASSGTDYSQQDSPQVSYTDLVIDGTTNTKITSSAHPFTSAHVGNVINITGGTGFTVQRVQIVSVASNVATCDKAVGTTSSTGGTGNLGGGLLTIATALGLCVAGNSIWIKKGTYALTSTLAPTVNVSFLGYNATHGDLDGTAWPNWSANSPTITTATNSTKLFNLSSATVYEFRNLLLSNTAATRAEGIYTSGNVTKTTISQCVLDGFSQALSGNNRFDPLDMSNVEIKNWTDRAIYLVNTGGNPAVYMSRCYIHGAAAGTNEAVNLGGAAVAVLVEVIVTGSGGIGVLIANSSATWNYFNKCSISKNNGDNVYCPSGGNLHAENSVFYGSVAGWGLNGNTPNFYKAINCAWGGNSSGDANTANGFNTGLPVISLSADPFTSSTDFSPNSTTGGGPLLKGASYPLVFPGGGSTTAADVGAIQSAGSGGGGGGTVAATNYIL